MLDIWILNVGQGDSIVLHYHLGTQEAFAVIDSNWSGIGEPAALTKLRELGANSLSFVALTHPHADHYTGLSVILDQYKGRISNFYSFRFSPFVNNRLRKLADAYEKIHGSTESTDVKRQMREFITILSSVKQQFGADRWIELDGVYNLLMPEGFDGIDIISVLPPARAKGYYIEMIEKGDLNIVNGGLKENDLSVAFLIRTAGSEIILGGDGTKANWIEQRRQWQRKSLALNASAAKLPHHGSKEDCAPAVLHNLFPLGAPAVACISADGGRHPHPDVFRHLAEIKVVPYCTNLSVSCGARFRDIISNPDLSPRLLRFLSTVLERSRYDKNPCQGDIRISVSDVGAIQFSPQFDHPCPYRSDVFSAV